MTTQNSKLFDFAWADLGKEESPINDLAMNIIRDMVASNLPDYELHAAMEKVDEILCQYKLPVVSSDASKWLQVTEDFWQYKENPEILSDDSGKTWHHQSDRDAKYKTAK